MERTIANLSTYANEFLQRNYGIVLTIPIQRNNRLRASHGRFVVTRNGTPIKIELAGYALTYGSTEAILGVLKHECIHYALHMRGEPNHDGHPFFESELKKHGAPSTNTVIIGKRYVFICNNCKKEYESRRKRMAIDPTQYRTKCCHATLTVTGERIYDGNKMTSEKRGDNNLT